MIYTPRVSIVTISFNQADFLRKTIDSVLSQDYSNVEYIVVDPGSTDGSRKIIADYGNRIAKVIMEPDQGPADGLNKGFAAATGEILGFLNSDDVFASGAIAAAVEFLLKNPRVDVVSGHAQIIGPDDGVLRLAYSDRMSLTGFLYSSVILIQPSTFFRRSAFERTRGFNTANRATWDGELFFDMARAGCRFAISESIWSGYRLHEQSVTSTKRLGEERQQAIERRFRVALGRDRTHLDRAIEVLFRFLKHVFNPRNTIQRILRGPVFGRKLT